mgnify:CR=1 FL=1
MLGSFLLALMIFMGLLGIHTYREGEEEGGRTDKRKVTRRSEEDRGGDKVREGSKTREDTKRHEEEEEKEITVYSLQQEGWEIVASDIHEESLPGLPPYEFLRRVISLTTYWLQRDKEEIVCQILYDSQLDRQQESCADSYPIPENGDA